MYKDHIEFLRKIFDAGISSDTIREIRTYISDKVEPNDDDQTSRRLYDLLTDLSYVDLSSTKKVESAYRFAQERAEDEIRDAIRDLEAYDVARHQSD